MTEKVTVEKPSKKETSGDRETKMTHLGSYEGASGKELRLHDAEFRGKHYFDFRAYEKRARGMAPTPKGMRLGMKAVEHLEDAIPKWKGFVKGLQEESTE